MKSTLHWWLPLMTVVIALAAWAHLRLEAWPRLQLAKTTYEELRNEENRVLRGIAVLASPQITERRGEAALVRGRLLSADEVAPVLHRLGASHNWVGSWRDVGPEDSIAGIPRHRFAAELHPAEGVAPTEVFQKLCALLADLPTGEAPAVLEDLEVHAVRNQIEKVSIQVISFLRPEA